MAEIEYPLEVKRIIEKIKLNMPSPESVTRECRRKNYAPIDECCNVYKCTCGEVF